MNFTQIYINKKSNFLHGAFYFIYVFCKRVHLHVNSVHHIILNTKYIDKSNIFIENILNIKF